VSHTKKKELVGDFKNGGREWQPKGQQSRCGCTTSEFAIDGDMRHAGYIQSWIGLLKHDCRAFFTACSKAQAAADYLRGLALRDQPTAIAA
jgi:antirestriction protein ArdC